MRPFPTFIFQPAFISLGSNRNSYTTKSTGLSATDVLSIQDLTKPDDANLALVRGRPRFRALLFERRWLGSIVVEEDDFFRGLTTARIASYPSHPITAY